MRKTFQLRDLDGLSTSETARILKVPHGTVKARLARARAKLREVMLRRSSAPRIGSALRQFHPVKSAA